MTPAAIEAKAPRTFDADRERYICGVIVRGTACGYELIDELSAERAISKLLASALQTARLQCDDPTRRKIDNVLDRWKGSE